ncbi:MAG: ribbon-helix-helix domain-containing protein [Candidatus Dadabacteria bacterium]|nr:ribbon-helix-helix domain-containing protein [Candidatus Dadabacteria bacterium]
MTEGTIQQRANPNKMHRGSLYIPSILYERLRLYSFISRTSQSKIIEEALTNYLDEHMTGPQYDNVLMYEKE